MTARLPLACALLAAGGALLRAAPAETAPAELSLADAQAIAGQQHPQVEIATLREKIAGENITSARAAYFPVADAYADAVEAGNANTRLLAGGLNNPVIYDRTADGVAISELLTDFGRTTNLVASARLEARAESENSAVTREQVLLNVDVNYYRALQAEAVLRVARETVQAQDTLARQIGALAQSRLRSQLDISFAQVGLEQARLLLQSAEGASRNAQASLSAALGYHRTHFFRLTSPAPASFPAVAAPPGASDEDEAEAAVDRALEQRPDLRRLRYEGEAAARQARAEKDRNFPIVSAIGTVGNAITHDNRLPNKYAAGGITVDLPLFAGGAYVARQRAAELRAQEAEALLRQEEDNVSRDVRVAWNNYRTARQRAATSAVLLRHAQEAMELAQARYRVGSSSIVELNQAQLNATSAEIGEAGARYDALVASALLDFATGALHP